jgi:DNA-binding IclR family transcriptional regulator
MTASQEEIAQTVYRRLEIGDIGEYSLDDRMLGVLMELDGEKDVGSIALAVGLSVPDTHDALVQLAKHNFVESNDDMVAVIDASFFEFLTAQLARAIGPIAGVVLEDTVADLGHTMSAFPRDQTAELVDALSREIQREEKKRRFKIDMVQIINEIG